MEREAMSVAEWLNHKQAETDQQRCDFCGEPAEQCEHIDGHEVCYVCSDHEGKGRDKLCTDLLRQGVQCEWCETPCDRQATTWVDDGIVSFLCSRHAAAMQH